ncbi:MAG: hypothetical protein HY237_08550 [Acidobacteria bacterium]|nr:hypothetical protein [Acidobacteriota bacterium]
MRPRVLLMAIAFVLALGATAAQSGRKQAPARPSPAAANPAASSVPAKGKKAVAPAERPLRRGRLYFGVPPTIPHDAGPEMNECLTCHADKDSGVPLTPHPARVRCRQCHVAAEDKAGEFHKTTFTGLRPPPRSPRLHLKAPPLMAHPVLLHENCLACHAPGARQDVIATPHPNRVRCQQCHVPQRASAGEFVARQP